MLDITPQGPSPHIAAAIQQIGSTDSTPLRRAEAMVEVALDLQRQPRDTQALADAIYLYEQAAALTLDSPLARARAVAGKGTALRRMPGAGPVHLEAAREAFEEALPVLHGQGEREEAAEIELNYGLVLQALASQHRASLPLAIQAYHRALRFFSPAFFPREYAIIHNNLATAYLSTAMASGKEGVREALAVQSFKEALRCISIDEDPVEYAMLQNNLGNALQATRSSHPFENLAQALAAYDEALRVRTPYDTPVEYANTIANKANALMNLPDDPADPSRGNPDNLAQAVALLREAQAIFREHQLEGRAVMLDEVLAPLVAELEPL